MPARSIEHRDPERKPDWLQALSERLDEQVRTRDLYAVPPVGMVCTKCNRPPEVARKWWDETLMATVIEVRCHGDVARFVEGSERALAPSGLPEFEDIEVTLAPPAEVR